MPGALAAQLGFDSFDALLSSPADRPVLLVVDNCEHLLDAAAHWLVQILGVCQQPTILATSRSPLELPGESVLPLAPLAVPGSESDPSRARRCSCSSSAAREAGAVVGPADLPAVVELCRRVDGLPLAIEIAAARARTMSIAEIVRPARRQRRRARPATLSRRPPAPQRGRHHPVVLRPAVAGGGRAASRSWPCSPVPSPARRRAPWRPSKTRPGSTRCWTSSPTPRSSRSTRADPRRGTACSRRSGSSPSTGCAAAARSEATYDRFADHVVASVREIVRGATTSWRPGLLRDLVAAFDDLAEALRWCTAHDTEPRRAYALCATLWGIVHQGRADDIADLARRTLARWPDQGSPAGAQCVAALATAEYVTGHPERALELVAPALAGPPLARAGVGHAAPGGGSGPTGGRRHRRRAHRLPRGGPGGARAGDAVDGDGARDRRRRGLGRPGRGGRRRRRARRARGAGRRLGLRHHRELGSRVRGGGCSCGSTRPPRCR